MDPDNSYREEAPVSMASRSADDENDSNPPGRSSPESAFLKTRRRCLKIGKNLYTEKIFREVEDMKGINIGGVNINNLRYADDTVLLAEGPMFLQALLTAVNKKVNHMAWK